MRPREQVIPLLPVSNRYAKGAGWVWTTRIPAVNPGTGTVIQAVDHTLILKGQGSRSLGSQGGHLPFPSISFHVMIPVPSIRQGLRSQPFSWAMFGSPSQRSEEISEVGVQERRPNSGPSSVLSMALATAPCWGGGVHWEVI